MTSIQASTHKSTTVAKPTLILLCALAGALAMPEYADAQSSRRSILKSAAKRLTSKPAATGAIKRESAAVRNRAALTRELQVLDKNVLTRIEARYGAYIDRRRMGRAKENQTTFLPHSRYQQQLKKAYPGLPPQQRRNVTGNYLRGRTYVDQNRVLLPRTVAHERMHQLADPRFRLHAGSRLDEGMTEFFSSKIYSDLRIKNMPVAYPHQTRVVEMMAARVGERDLARAYFGGKISPLQRQLDSQLGPGSFRKIVRALESGRHNEAARILQAAR